MLLTLRGTNANLTAGGIFTFNLSENYDVESVELISVSGVGHIQGGVVYNNYNQNPNLYASMVSGYKSDSYLNYNGGDLPGFFPIGLLKDIGESQKNNMLNNPLPIGNLIQTFGSTIQIKVIELLNGLEFTDDIDNFYFNDEDPAGEGEGGEGEGGGGEGGEGEGGGGEGGGGEGGEGGEGEDPIYISNTGLNFVFNIKLCSHNTLTVND